MPTGFDDFTKKAHLDYTDLTDEQLSNRALLIVAMGAHGFTPLDTEWWHYDAAQAEQYPLSSISFEKL